MLLSAAAMVQAQTTVNVETAGTLSSKISADEKYTITDLTVTGQLNGTDFVFLRAMAGQDQDNNKTEGSLEKLDLSGATVVSGGDAYFVKYGGKADTEYYTKDNQMSGCMFANCAALKSIVVPTNTETIGDSCFFKCTSLESVTFPETVKEIRTYAFAYTALPSFTFPKTWLLARPCSITAQSLRA